MKNHEQTEGRLLAADTARDDERDKADADRVERRVASDGHGRTEQGIESLKRERDADDVARIAERDRDVATCGTERAVADAKVERAVEARSHAEDAMVTSRDAENVRGAAVRGTRSLIRDELRIIGTKLGELQARVPQETYEAIASETLKPARAALDRALKLVEDLDPGDSACRHHEVGGSG